MIKKYISICSLFMSPFVFSQTIKGVGIGVDQPQQQLHVGGLGSVPEIVGNTGVSLVHPTVRIDMLNKANNPRIHPSDYSVQPVYVNNLGDLKPVKGLELIKSSLGEDLITTPVSLTITQSTGTNASYAATADLAIITFTLEQPSIVYFDASLSGKIQTSAGTSYTDGYAKGLGVNLRIISSTNALVTPRTFINHTATNTSYTTGSNEECMQFKASTELILPEGTYTIGMRGVGITYEADVRAVFGNCDDKLSVYSRPL